MPKLLLSSSELSKLRAIRFGVFLDVYCQVELCPEDLETYGTGPWMMIFKITDYHTSKFLNHIKNITKIDDGAVLYWPDLDRKLSISDIAQKVGIWDASDWP